MFELHKRYAVEIEDGVSPSGIKAVSDYVYNKFAFMLPAFIGREWIYTAVHPWQTKWTEIDGRKVSVPVTYSGKYAKRVISWLRDEIIDYNDGNSWRGIRMPMPTEIDSNEIGNLASQYRMKNDLVFLDVTDNVYLECGKFGDDCSCFYGSNAGALHVMSENGTMAIRFWSDMDSDRGLGRAWLNYAPSGYIVWNGYAKNSLFGLDRMDDSLTRPMASVFANLLTKENGNEHVCSRIIATNYGTGYRLVYINSEAAYHVRSSKAEKIEEYDFKFETLDNYYCEDCDDLIHPGDLYISESKSTVLCWSCLERRNEGY